jgi:hypothetical protein
MEKGLVVAFNSSEWAKTWIDCGLKYQANGPENCRTRPMQFKDIPGPLFKMKGRSLLLSFVRVDGGEWNSVKTSLSALICVREFI